MEIKLLTQMAEESNQEEKDKEDIFADEHHEDETEKSNSQKGEESDDAALTPEELAKYNERTGKNYKSLTWDEIANKEKIADEAFRTKKVEPKKEEPKQTTPSVNDEVIEELLLTKHPEAEHVLDDLKETAKLKGVSILKLFRESKYFQGEAKSLADAKKVEEEAKSKIKPPSNGTAPQRQDISSVKPEEVVNLKPAEKSAWLKAQAEKERRSED